MAQKKTITTETVVDGEGSNEDTPEKLDDDVIRALTELDGSDDVRWQVHRVSQPNPGYCEPELSTGELSLQRIAQDHGPGRYRVKGIKPDGKYFRSTMLTIAAPSKTKTADSNELLTLLQNSKKDDSVMPLMMAMMQQQTSVMVAALQRPERTTSNFPWSGLIAASPLLLAEVRNFLSKKDSDEQSMEKILKLVTIVEKLRGNDEKTGSSWQDIVRDALSSVPALVAARANTSNNGAAPRPNVSATVVPDTSTRLSAPTEKSIIETPEAIEPTTEMLSMQWLTKKLDELIQKAAANKNPELHAEVFVDDLPVYIPETFVVQMLSQDDWFEKLSAFDQRVLTYHGWFSEFRDALLDTLSPDELPKTTDKKGDEDGN